MSAPPQTTHFITFYSFKGGVGRTMALLNAAHYLAAAGLDVLMIDADLEAPGLTLAHKRRHKKEARGFIALYEECRGFIESGAEPKDAPHKLKGYLHPLTVKTPPLPGVERPGRLALLPAHPSDASADAYLRQLGELSIREVVGKGLAVYVAEVIRARVREEGFDYALIDSRTGWSEAAGFCVMGLADALAVVSGLNEQNLLGTKDFLEFVAGREDEAPKPVLRVLSPVPTAKEELKEKRFRRARELLGGEVDVQIPYHPRIALIEEPFVVTRPDHHVTEQYRRAARAVLALVGDDPETHLREATRLISEDKIEESLSRLRRACPFARDGVIQVLRLFTTQVLDAKGGAPPWGDDAF
ncbi:MAG: AAA family ATPase, partial [Nitrospinota bacterium]|nr:AAA family ATPase [Nitrospinota bacterium]